MAKSKTTSVKVDPKKVEALAKKGINLSDLVRKAMDDALEVCPWCNQKMKNK